MSERGDVMPPDRPPGMEGAPPHQQGLADQIGRATVCLQEVLASLASAVEQESDPPTPGADSDPDPPTRVAIPEIPPDPLRHRLHCTFLGPFQIFHNDRAIRRWRNQRSMSVLAYLASQHPAPVRSEVLMDTFWRDAEPQSARNNLHVAVYGVRRSFEDNGCAEPHIEFRNDMYGFAADLSVTTDIDEFELASERGAEYDRSGDTVISLMWWRRALSLYRGSYLDNDPYAEWAQSERRRLHHRLCDVLDAVGRRELEDGDVGSCIGSTLRLADLEPYHEDAHTRLMRAYAQSGRHHLAVELYERFATRLADELDAVPDAETQLLASRVRRRMPV